MHIYGIDTEHVDDWLDEEDPLDRTDLIRPRGSFVPVARRSHEGRVGLELSAAYMDKARAEIASFGSQSPSSWSSPPQWCSPTPQETTRWTEPAISGYQPRPVIKEQTLSVPPAVRHEFPVIEHTEAFKANVAWFFAHEGPIFPIQQSLVVEETP